MYKEKNAWTKWITDKKIQTSYPFHFFVDFEQLKNMGCVNLNSTICL
jgi:hypothetical protein